MLTNQFEAQGFDINIMYSNNRYSNHRVYSLHLTNKSIFSTYLVLISILQSLLFLQRISERALDGLNNLKTLNLRNNLLKKIDTGLLRGTPALLSINVQANKLETLTFYTFQPIMDNLVNSTSELLVSGELIADNRRRNAHRQRTEQCRHANMQKFYYNYAYATLAWLTRNAELS